MMLLDEGLCPQHKVLDFGCGALRVGYWLIRLLDAEQYFGIEPAGRRLKMGQEHIVGPELMAAKRPRFDENSEFNMAVFGEKFDFIYARSVWSHCARWQIEKTLDSVVEVLAQEGAFYVSYLPAANEQDAFMGDDTKWLLVRHSGSYIQEECKKRRLRMKTMIPRSQRDLEFTLSSGQRWLKITR